MSPSLDPASVAAGAALAAVLLKLCGGGASSGAGDAPEPTAAPRMSRAEEEAAEAAALAAWAAEDAAEGAAAAASAAPAETAPRSSILCVGLNPAYQKSMQFKQLTVDAVNRAEAIHFSAGGKGQHCAVAANLYVPGCAEVVQFLGDEGPAGPFIVDYMRSKRCAETALTEWVPGMKTRMCTTLLYGDQGAMTELIDPSETIPMHHVGALKARLMSAIVRPETRAVCVCGTFPPGVGPSLYAEIAAAKLGMGIHGAILVIDAYKGIGDALSTGACDLLKINAAELHALIGGGEAGVEGLGREEVVLRDMALAFHPSGGPMASCPKTSVLAVTDGPSAAYMMRATGETWRLKVPAVSDVANPIGAGDTVTGVMVAALVCGDALEQAFAKGLAAASASCKGMQGAVYQQEEYERLLAGVVIEKL